MLAGLVRGYQRWISPALPPSCRFYPSCSSFAMQALTEHGALRGSWLAARRLLRCGPWHPGGLDPVPPRRHGTRDPAPIDPEPVDPDRSPRISPATTARPAVEGADVETAPRSSHPC